MPCQAVGRLKEALLPLQALVTTQRVTHLAMTKSLEAISETVTNPKHPFPKVDNHVKKPSKHRYERRKVKEYLHLGQWGAEAT
jgi:hypothetical protein